MNEAFVSGKDKPIENLLIVAEDLEYDRTSCGLLNTKMVFSLASRFHTHLLVSGSLGDPIKEAGLVSYHQFHPQKSWLWKLIGKIPILRSIPEWLTGINHASFYKYLSWKGKLKSALLENRFDVVLFLGSGMGWYAHMAYSSLPAFKSVVGMSLHDPFPMAILPEPYKIPMSFGQKRLMKRLNFLIETMQGCYAPSLRLVEHMSVYYPSLAKKCEVVPHLAYQLPFLAQQQGQGQPLPELDGLNSKDHFLILHLGTLLEGRSPRHFLKAMVRFLQEFPDAARVTKVVFIGNVHTKLLPEFEEVANHPNFILHTNLRISYADAVALQHTAAANLIIESDKYHSPQLFGKFADSVLANKPIVCLGPPSSEARRVLGENYPYQATNGNFDEIYSMLKLLYENWKLQPEQTLNRPDLQYNFSPNRLRAVVEGWLKNKE